MDQNLVRNPNEPFAWQNIFKPKKNRPMTGPVAQNLAGKSGFPNQLNRRPGSETPKLRINLLRLNSQGEDCRSPPVVPYECNFYQQIEDNFYQNEMPMNRIKKSFNISPTGMSVDCASGVEWPSPPTRRLHDNLNSVEEIMQENMFQTENSQSSGSSNINHSFKFLNFAQQLSTFFPNENKRAERLSSSSPLMRRLPYLRPTVPIGLSASAILFGRYQQAERSMNKNNLASMNKNRSDMCTSSSSILLAKLELAKLISGNKLTGTQHLPQQKQVTKPVVVNITTNTNISDDNMKSENMGQVTGNTETKSDTQDNKCDHKKKSEISVVNAESRTETKNKSFISSEDSDHSDEDSISDVESEDDEDEDSSSDSETSGSISDFESDTESYDSSSESDTGFDSDAESWSSDVKDPVPTCQNAIISFILGQSTDAAGGKDSGLDENDEPLIKDRDQVDDHVWHSLNASEDPYNPINGWKCSSGSPFQSMTPVSEGQHTTKGQLKSGNCTLIKIHCDVTKPSDHFVSGDSISNEDIHLCKQYSDSPAVKPSKTKLNDVVDETKSENKCAANIVNIVKNTKSCFKNKLSRHQQKLPKKVSFSCKDVSSVAYENPEWCDDYRETRKPYWESFARDRCRFKRRIKEIGDIISYCFDPAHRRKMIEKFNVNS